MLWPGTRRILSSGTGLLSTSACFPKVISMKNFWLFSAPPNICQKVLQWSYYSIWFPCLGVYFLRAWAFLLRSTGKGGGAGGTLGLHPILLSRSPAPPPSRWAHPAASSQLPEGIWDFHGNSGKMDLTSPWKIASEHPRLPSLILLRWDNEQQHSHSLSDGLSQCYICSVLSPSPFPKKFPHLLLPKGQETCFWNFASRGKVKLLIWKQLRFRSSPETSIAFHLEQKIKSLLGKYKLPK